MNKDTFYLVKVIDGHSFTINAYGADDYLFDTTSYYRVELHDGVVIDKAFFNLVLPHSAVYSAVVSLVHPDTSVRYKLSDIKTIQRSDSNNETMIELEEGVGYPEILNIHQSYALHVLSGLIDHDIEKIQNVHANTFTTGTTCNITFINNVIAKNPITLYGVVLESISPTEVEFSISTDDINSFIGDRVDYFHKVEIDRILSISK